VQSCGDGKRNNTRAVSQYPTEIQGGSVRVLYTFLFVFIVNNDNFTTELQTALTNNIKIIYVIYNFILRFVKKKTAFGVQ